jgi:hypothetical protein
MRRDAVPASVQSLPTNGHNQDIVPFGTQAALTAMAQAERLRWLHGSLAVALRQGAHLSGVHSTQRRAGAPRCLAVLERLSAVVAPVDPDRRHSGRNLHGDDRGQRQPGPGPGTVRYCRSGHRHRHRATCLEYSGNLLVTGTGTAKVQLPGAQCTGDENEGTNDVAVTWSDGTTSHIHYGKIHGVETAGLVAVSESGTVAPTSTKFANDASSLTGELIGQGCGTATGETSGHGVSTVMFSH